MTLTFTEHGENWLMVITSYVFSNIALVLAALIPALAVAAVFLWALGLMEGLLLRLPDPIAILLFGIVLLTGLLVAADVGLKCGIAYAEWTGLAR